DAWLTWTIWKGESRGVADVVALARDLRIYRDAGVALTRRGPDKPMAREFAAFLASTDAARSFQHRGWTIESQRPRHSRRRRNPAGTAARFAPRGEPAPSAARRGRVTRPARSEPAAGGDSGSRAARNRTSARASWTATRWHRSQS